MLYQPGQANTKQQLPTFLCKTVIQLIWIKVIFNFKPNKQCEVFVYTISVIQRVHMCSLIPRWVVQRDDHLSQRVSTMITESLAIQLQSSQIWQQVIGVQVHQYIAGTWFLHLQVRRYEGNVFLWTLQIIYHTTRTQHHTLKKHSLNIQQCEKLRP
jgi:hypothetical protein